MSYPQISPELPLVSVIVPAYNAETFLERTLNSILAQTYPNFEVLVIDDGSEDKTAEIVKRMAEKDSRIRLLQQINSGVAAARNLGIKKARGEFIAPIDADDLWHPQNLEKQVKYLLNADSSVGLTYAWSVDIDENDILRGEFRTSTIEGKVYPILLLHYFIANASSTVIRSKVFEKIAYYNEDLKIKQAGGCEDWEIYLRIAEFYEFRVIPEFLIGYRKLNHSMSSNGESMAKSLLEVWHLVLEKYPHIPKIMYRLSLGSFYMYLARQSSFYGRHKKTLFWLYEALKMDFITPYLRLSLYTLFLKSCFYIILKKEESDRDFLETATQQSSGETIKFIDLRTPIIYRKGIKNLVENILSKLIPLIFGTPNQWKKYEEIGL